MTTTEPSHVEKVDQAIAAAQCGNAIAPKLVMLCLADEVLVLRAQLVKLESAFEAADAEATQLRVDTAALRAKVQAYQPIVARAGAVRDGTGDKFHGLVFRRTADWITKAGAP